MSAEALTFVLRETGDVNGYACPKCKKVYTSAYDNPGEKEWEAVRRIASECCAPRVCEDCGKITGDKKKYIYMYCPECRGKRDAERERKLFDKAKKVPYEQYDGTMLYLDDQWFDDVWELYDHCIDNTDEGEDVVYPEYAWACKLKKFVIEADRIVESALEEHHEDAYDSISREAFEELQRLLDAWCAKQGVTSYEYDLSVAVLIPSPPDDYRDDST